MNEQLAFDLPFIEGFEVENFYLSLFNQAAFRMVSHWPYWPDSIAIIQGVEGCGKSHLSHIWAQKANAQKITPQDLSAVQNINPARAFLIEDCDRYEAIYDHKIDEKALFHLINLVRENKGFLLITARTNPNEWGLQTPDLLSRLRLAPLVKIDAPDDTLFRALLAKLLHDRQLSVEPNVIEYLYLRIERSYASARTVVASLDRHSLAKNRAITRAIAAEVLRELEYEAESIFI